MHPRKYAVVSLAEGCVADATSASLKKTHDIRNDEACGKSRTYAVYTRLSPSSERNSTEEQSVFTRVSAPCWPCLCVMFMHRSITHKKSQHRSFCAEAR